PSLTRGVRSRFWSFVAGLGVFVIAADWPVAALGASHLLSMHTLQYMLYAFGIPGFIIYGVPPDHLRRVVSRQPIRSLLKLFNRPLPALIGFNLILLATHLPNVVDGLTATQMGSFVINMAWLFSGFLFWWHIIGPLPEMNPMSYPKRLLFLLANVFAPVVPASFMLFSKFPIYSTYELAVRVGSLTSIDDQRIAAVVMKVLGVFILLGIGSVLFFKWNRHENDPVLEVIGDGG
ncbi:MAG: cytochrome c oxidase assembly protein, partial [Gemmatimonadales bacterium]